MFVLKFHRRIDVNELSHSTSSRFWKGLFGDGSNLQLTINTTNVLLVQLKQNEWPTEKLKGETRK